MKMILTGVALLLSATSAQAITVDGTLDAAYGAPTATVGYDPAAPNSNFGTPTNTANATGYRIYLTSDTNNVFGFLQADNPGAGAFANLYFDIDPAANNGSDLGFEITNKNAFVPGRAGSVSASQINFAINAAQTAIEFSIPNTYFTAPIAGLNYYDGQTFPANGGQVVLRISQSFNYTANGGATYGPNRLGAVTIGGTNAVVPEPSAWALMLAGFGGMGAALRRRRTTSVAYA